MKLRFTLKRVLVVLAFSAVLLSWVVRQRQLFMREVAARNTLASYHDAYIVFDGDDEDDPYVAFNDEGDGESVPRWDVSELKHGRLYRPITEVYIADAVIDERAVQSLSALRFLSRLKLQHCDLRAKLNTRAFGSLPITELHIDNVPLRRTDVHDITRLKKVTQLSLRKTGITDESVELVGKLTALTVLDLGNNAIADRAIQHLASLSRLEYISLADTKITGRSTQWLRNLQHLRVVNLRGTGVDSEAITDLAFLPAIQALSLSHTRVDDGCVPILMELISERPNFWLCSVNDTQISQAEQDNIKHAFTTKRQEMRPPNF